MTVCTIHLSQKVQPKLTGVVAPAAGSAVLCPGAASVSQSGGAAGSLGCGARLLHLLQDPLLWRGGAVAPRAGPPLHLPAVPAPRHALTLCHRRRLDRTSEVQSLRHLLLSLARGKALGHVVDLLPAILTAANSILWQACQAASQALKVGEMLLCLSLGKALGLVTSILPGLSLL